MKCKNEILEIIHQGNDIFPWGQIREKPTGYVCVWKGRNPAILKIEGRHKSGNYFTALAEYNSLHPSNLRYATAKEVQLLGILPILKLKISRSEMVEEVYTTLYPIY